MIKGNVFISSKVSINGWEKDPNGPCQDNTWLECLGE